MNVRKDLKFPAWPEANSPVSAFKTIYSAPQLREFAQATFELNYEPCYITDQEALELAEKIELIVFSPAVTNRSKMLSSIQVAILDKVGREPHQ